MDTIDDSRRTGGDTIGAPLRRFEDERFLIGAGRYIADLTLPGQWHAVFLRSPHAHAAITGIDTAAARRAPGVRAVLTAGELDRDALGGIPWEVAPPVDDPAVKAAPLGSPEVAPPQPLMAGAVVRYVGEIVAMVVADDERAALDASELIEVGYEERTPYASIKAAMNNAGGPIWPQFKDNIGFVIQMGERDGAEAAFASAHHVETLAWTNNRIAGNPIEARGYVGDYAAGDDRMILHAPAGKPHAIRDTMAAFVFGVPKERIVVKVPDIGGGFGVKNILYPEQCLVLWAARRLKRPVKWIGRRNETMASDIGGRDQIGETAMAFDRDGRALALRIRSAGNLGGYLAPRGVVPLRNSLSVAASVYDIAQVDCEIRGVFTNTAPTCSYRGAGQPEGIFPTERLLDRAAAALGIDAVEIRRRNLIRPAAMPYRTPLGMTYDSGDFPALMEAALAAADRPGFAARRKGSERAGRLRGWGIANCLELCGFGYGEQTELVVGADGIIDLLIGTQSSGQGHATVYAQIAADHLGIPAGCVRVVQGDTERIATGSGTGASRSLTVGGSATILAARTLIETGRDMAAGFMEVEARDVAYQDGRYQIAGTDLRMTLAEIAARAPADVPFAARESYTPAGGTFPTGCHVCEVEVDPETGAVAVVRYCLAQDVGKAVNPLIIKGQLDGGVALGIGQALFEHMIYDRETGQLVTGSFIDYAMPRADDFPDFEATLLEVPSTNNPLGARGVGESGALGAPAAVINALIDALAPLGVRDIAMPATPHRVWRAIADAAARQG